MAAGVWPLRLKFVSVIEVSFDSFHDVICSATELA